MGVLRCDRKNCSNTMCDRCSSRFGYICDDCFEELVNLGPEASIEEFMSKPKIELHTEARRRAAEILFDAEFPLAQE